MLNIPNMLSLFRLFLVPVFVLLYFSGFQCARYLATAVFVLATVTDYLDGFIARKYDIVTNLGKVLDPLGDKLLTLAVLACIASDGRVPYWVAIVYFSKEALIVIGGVYIHRKVKEEMPQANFLGKSATVLFFLFCVILLLCDRVTEAAAVSMLSFAIAVSMLAFVSYFVNLIRIMKRKRAESREAGA